MSDFEDSCNYGGLDSSQGEGIAGSPPNPPCPPDYKSRISIAKITQPRCTGVLGRTRLFRLLDACRRHPVTWISAPAGSGKTTLVSSYLSHKKVPCIWYRVDEGDGDIATFFYYMGLAAKKASSRKRISLPLFTPEFLMGMPAFSLRYFEHLYHALKPNSVIVLDNYHRIPAHSGLHEVIRAGLEILPEEVRVILISRENPPPIFARLRVSGTIALIGAGEVAFTLEESRRLIQLKAPRPMTDLALRRIHDRTRGWAAGLVLMSGCISRDGLDPEFESAATPRELFDYLAAEIFDDMDAEMREFLLKTVFLPVLTGAMAEQVAECANASGILSQLYRSHFLVERSSLPNHVYRYHPLFREFLQTRAEALLLPEEIRRIRRRSAETLEAEGEVEDALGLLVDAGEWEEAASIILRHGHLLLTQGRGRTLEAWLKRMPEELLQRSPLLLYWMGQIRMAAWP